MSEEKTQIEDVLRRVDDLIRILKFLSEDLVEISKTLKSFAVISTSSPQPSSHPKLQTTAQQTIAFSELSEIRTADDIRKFFPPDLVDSLLFEVTEEYALVKPRQFLGSDNFRRIALIVRDRLGGEYVSAGKDSHFRVRRKA